MISFPTFEETVPPSSNASSSSSSAKEPSATLQLAKKVLADAGQSSRSTAKRQQQKLEYLVSAYNTLNPHFPVFATKPEFLFKVILAAVNNGSARINIQASALKTEKYFIFWNKGNLKA